MTNEAENARRRPAGVWVISGFYALSMGCVLLSYVLLLSGPAVLRTAVGRHLEAMGVVGWFFTLAMGVSGLSAALFLFLLRRAAVALFVVAFGLNLGYTVYLALATDWFETINASGLVSIVLAWISMGAVILYARGLAKSGVLR
jgi:hypothetical protein